MLRQDLEAWLTEKGDQIIRKRAFNGPESLSEGESLVYAVWLIDTERRNGGVSQYFCNRGLGEWDRLIALASSRLPSFDALASAVEPVVRHAVDPYLAILDVEKKIDGVYDDCSTSIVAELRLAFESGV